MPLYDDEHQTTPQSEPDELLSELRGKVNRTVTVLEENKKLIQTWFLKVILGLNMLLGSVVFWLVVIPFLLEYAAKSFSN